MNSITCRDEILAAFASLRRETGRDTFTVLEVLERMRGTAYAESTVRTHITSVMCRDAPKNHGTVYDDLERVARGRYRVRSAVRGR